MIRTKGEFIAEKAGFVYFHDGKENVYKAHKAHSTLNPSDGQWYPRSFECSIDTWNSYCHLDAFPKINIMLGQHKHLKPEPEDHRTHFIATCAHGWGRGETIEEAVKLARSNIPQAIRRMPKKEFKIYRVTADTTVDSFNWHYPEGQAPIEVVNAFGEDTK